MPKGKGYRDQFNLGALEKAAGNKRKGEQPKSSRSVKGAEAPSGNRGLRPSKSRNVKGVPGE